MKIGKGGRSKSSTPTSFLVDFRRSQTNSKRWSAPSIGFLASADHGAYEALRLWCRRMAEPVASHGKRSLRSIAKALRILPMTLLRRKDRALAIISANYLATTGATI